MHEPLARWTGVAGIAGTVIQLAALWVYLNEAGSPPNTEAALVAFLSGNNAVLQTSFLLFFVAVAVWFVFFAGLRSLLARSKHLVARNLLPAVLAQEPGELVGLLELGDVAVQKEAIGELVLEHHVLIQ